MSIWIVRRPGAADRVRRSPPRPPDRLRRLRPRPFDPHPIRIGCTMLLVAYGAITVLRHDPSHPEFLYIRGAVCAYAALAAALAPRFTWSALRAFTVGLALLLPLGAAYVDGT